ncbi:MAG: sensor histidine kinase [Planctomycetota bacterium]|jgi:signal transduction histidine kinase
MRINLKRAGQRLLKLLRLWPLSLAEKCRVTFGAAVLFILALALLLPYIWMGQLTKKAALDAGRAKGETLMRRHFQSDEATETVLPRLDGTGGVLDANDAEMRWIPLTKGDDQSFAQLADDVKEVIEALKAEEGRYENVVIVKQEGRLASDYVRVFRATDSCIGCHNPEGSASAFSRNEPIGAVIIQSPAGEISRTRLVNLVWVIVAGLIAGAGAIVAFYMITQRVILRPIRQLRAIANNVAEGNLDTRSAIKTRDEYEKLANAFNHMLDRLQAAQEKLRQANKQLDDKIVELSERNIELFKANKVKGEFLANISHEFRTPLNAILGFAEIMREKPDIIRKEKGQRYAENIMTSGNRLLNMVNDLLNMAKTEAGKMELHIEKTSVPALCKMVVGHFSALTKKKKIKVKLLVDNHLPPLTTDGGKVEQILYNFLSNAVKFTPEAGRIEIRARMVDEKTARISVTDSGCGIAEADKEKIFEKFRQVDGSITRQSAGSGLGLAISKELAAMLAGSVGLESEQGKGSTFWLDIPIVLTKNSSQTE